MKSSIALILAVAAAAVVVVLMFSYVTVHTDGDSDDSMEGSDIVGHASVGQAYEFSLKSNATTGYQWFVVGGDDDLTVETKYVPDSNPLGMSGVGGKEYFYVYTEKAGTYHLFLEYKRGWENAEPADKVALQVTFD